MGNGSDPPPPGKPVDLRAQCDEEGSGSESVDELVVVATSRKRKGNGVGGLPVWRSKRARRLPTEDASDSGDICPEWCYDDGSLLERVQQARHCGIILPTPVAPTSSSIWASISEPSHTYLAKSWP